MEYHFICCGNRFDQDTAGKRNKAHKIHKKGIKHKISQAVSQSWVDRQKAVKNHPSCGLCGSQLTKGDKRQMTYEGIIICKCGHGKPHHKGKFGECTCLMKTMREYVYKQCECQSLDVVKTIFKGQVTLQENRVVMDWIEGDKGQLSNYFIICKKCKGWHEKGNWCQDSDFVKGMNVGVP